MQMLRWVGDPGRWASTQGTRMAKSCGARLLLGLFINGVSDVGFIVAGSRESPDFLSSLRGQWEAWVRGGCGISRNVVGWWVGAEDCSGTCYN